MGRKISAVIMCVLLVICVATPANAYTHEVYDNGTISNTYITYFRDILSGVSINKNYIAFRDTDKSYIMVVGKLDIDGNVIALQDTGTAYIFRSDGTNYSSQYKYYVEEITEFNVDCDNYIVYSDLGHYPQLMERGAKFEVITAVLIGVALLSVVINRIFRKC